jgi:hypothetical protein
MPDRHRGRAHDGEPVLRPLPRLARDRRAVRRRRPTPVRKGLPSQRPARGALPRPVRRARPHPTRVGPRRRPQPVPGVQPQGPRAQLDRRPRATRLRLSRSGHGERRVRDELLPPGRHPRARAHRPDVHGDGPASRVTAGSHVPEPPVPVLRDLRGIEDQPPPARSRPLPRPDRLRAPRARGRAGRRVLHEPSDRAVLGSTDVPVRAHDRPVLRRRRRRHAPQRHVRHSLGRRAVPHRRPPSRRHRAGTALHRGGLRCIHAVTAMAPWDVHPHVRRVGRLLRPRAPTGRARRAREPGRLRQLRAARVPSSVAARVAVRAPRLRGPRSVRPHVSLALPRVAVPRRARAGPRHARRHVVPHQARPAREQHRRQPPFRPPGARVDFPTPVEIAAVTARCDDEKRLEEVGWDDQRHEPFEPSDTLASIVRQRYSLPSFTPWLENIQVRDLPIVPDDRPR